MPLFGYQSTLYKIRLASLSFPYRFLIVSSMGGDGWGEMGGGRGWGRGERERGERMRRDGWGERARRDGLGGMVWKSTAYYHSADISHVYKRVRAIC